MVIKIQRWSPATCKCVVEQQVDYDDEEKREPIVSFLMMNEVCDEHQHMKTIRHREDHKDRSEYVLNLIEEAKARNVKQHDEAIKRTKRRHHLRQLHELTHHIHKHNQAITEEWQELVEDPHCWDEHIYDHIISQQKKKDG